MGDADGKEDERMRGDTKEDSDVEVEPERLQYKVHTCYYEYLPVACAAYRSLLNSQQGARDRLIKALITLERTSCRSSKGNNTV